jgi:hypothetical protein
MTAFSRRLNLSPLPIGGFAQFRNPRVEASLQLTAQIYCNTIPFQPIPTDPVERFGHLESYVYPTFRKKDYSLAHGV